ncbi:hypothetical protein [Bradyrhizobium arachidis]|nr:hypothetical protein [Bradyrhizobium arachidis]
MIHQALIDDLVGGDVIVKQRAVVLIEELVLRRNGLCIQTRSE